MGAIAPVAPVLTEPLQVNAKHIRKDSAFAIFYETNYKHAIELVCQASKGHPYMMSSNSVTHTHSRGHVLEITIFAGPLLSSFEMMLSMIGP